MDAGAVDDGKGGSVAKSDGGPGNSGATGGAGSTGTPGDLHAPGNPPVKSAGCGNQNPKLKTGTQTITSSGQSRQYIIDIPTDYDSSKPYRLIFGLHWMGGTMTDVATGQTVTKDVWSYFGLKKLDTPRSAIFVAPQGTGNGWANTNGQDTTLLDDIIKTVSDDLCVDTTRIFAGGFSYGGMFSSTLACTRTNVFRALAPQNGSASCASPKPVAFLCSGSNDGSKTSLLSYARGIAKANGCTNPNEDMPQPAAGSKSHICTSFSGCPAAYPVRYCAFDANHKAAPCDGCGPEQDNGNTTWTPAEVWKFYTQF
jgi:poly(3-hydroxybutyrate) depolymerase